MRIEAGRLRIGTPPKRSTSTTKRQDPRIHVDFAHLCHLEAKGRSLNFLPRQPAHSAMNGRHASRMRGRGLSFEELREYLPSDDVRSIDWKVTARTGTPHVRVFTEERDRPAMVVVDQRMSMFFGSVLNMKSVTAAECAALTAFAILGQGDRVGGLVFSDEIIAEIRPKRNRTALNQLLKSIAQANGSLRADAPNVEPVPINAVLRTVARIAPRNHLIVFLSDFSGIDEDTRKVVSGIARKNDLILGLVSDPIADTLPPDMQIAVSDGTLQMAINTADRATHQALSQVVTGRLSEILDWQRTTGVPVLPLSSGQDSLVQMRRLMGLAGR